MLTDPRDDMPDFIIIVGGDRQRRTVDLLDPNTTAGREFVSSVLCMNYADGVTLEN